MKHKYFIPYGVRCRHFDCKYRAPFSGVGTCCDYISKTGHARRCNAADCDKYDKLTDERVMRVRRQYIKRKEGELTKEQALEKKYNMHIVDLLYTYYAVYDMSVRDIAEVLGISKSYVHDLLRKYEVTKHIKLEMEE